MTQNYAAYTDADRLVWRTLFDRQMGALETAASDAFLTAVEEVGFNADKIPNFNELNELLGERTRFRLEAVPHIVENDVFFPLLASRAFTATTWLRRMEQLDYLEEPDMFHDVFGHVPLLSNSTFCDFFCGLANIAMKHLNKPEVLILLGRMYWFTIEFGLIRESGAIKIYGAGIASSFGETKHCLSGIPIVLPFDVRTILNTPFDNMKIQDLYFVIESFDQLFESLGEIQRVVREIA